MTCTHHYNFRVASLFVVFCVGRDAVFSESETSYAAGLAFTLCLDGVEGPRI